MEEKRSHRKLCFGMDALDTPFSYVAYDVWTKLSELLDHDQGISANNWRMLAAKLGYSAQQILCLECKRPSHGRYTLNILEEFLKRQSNSIRVLRDSLLSIDRHDALQVLLGALPEAYFKYCSSLEQKEFSVTTSKLKVNLPVPTVPKADMEDRQATRRLKAFVTFACDSDKHLRMVVNLTLCLERNGARAAMDMFHYTMPTDDKIVWIRRMYAEAEIIVVCISPQYMIQADPLMTNVTVNGNGLHTSFIYRMIQKELETTGTCQRIICVMVGDDTTPGDIPDLLKSCSAFLWPIQYGSVLSYLLLPNCRDETRYSNGENGHKTYTQL